MICAYHAVLRPFEVFSGLGNGPPLPRAEKRPFLGILFSRDQTQAKSCPVVHNNKIQLLQNAFHDVDCSPVAPFLDFERADNWASGFACWANWIPLDLEIFGEFFGPRKPFFNGRSEKYN